MSDAADTVADALPETMGCVSGPVENPLEDRRAGEVLVVGRTVGVVHVTPDAEQVPRADGRDGLFGRVGDVVPHLRVVFGGPDVFLDDVASSLVGDVKLVVTPQAVRNPHALGSAVFHTWNVCKEKK